MQTDKSMYLHVYYTEQDASLKSETIEWVLYTTIEKDDYCTSSEAYIVQADMPDGSKILPDEADRMLASQQPVKLVVDAKDLNIGDIVRIHNDEGFSYKAVVIEEPEDDYKFLCVTEDGCVCVSCPQNVKWNC